MKTNDTGTLLLTVAETAVHLRLSENAVYQLLYKGELPSAKIGRCRRIPRDGLERWINERTVGGAA